MFKFLHTADIHLDSPLHRLEAYEGAPVEQVRQASRRAFENLIDFALGESVDLVLIAGDLFDGDWKDYNTGLYFVSQIGRLKAAGIPVFIVSGNHDAAGQMTRSLPYPDNVHVFSHRRPETQTIEHLKLAVHGRSFAAPAVLENLVPGYPEPIPGYFNIGLLHTSLTGREGHEPYAPCTLEDLVSRGYDYWALGHAHRFEVVSDDPCAVFAGCIQGRHIRETGPKGCVLVTVAEGVAPQPVHQPLDVIRWQRLEVDLGGTDTAAEGLERFAAVLEAALERQESLPLIARVVFSGETAAAAEIAGDLGYWQEAVRSTAIAHGGDRVWIEKIMVQIRPGGRGSRQTMDPGPLQELERLTDRLESDDAALTALADELTGLFRRLPAEYRRGEGALDPADPDRMRRLVEQARDLLVRRLRGEAAGR